MINNIIHLYRLSLEKEGPEPFEIYRQSILEEFWLWLRPKILLQNVYEFPRYQSEKSADLIYHLRFNV